MSFGIWVDDPVSDVKKPSFWRELKRHGIRTAAIMLEGVGKGFDVKYSVPDLQRIAHLARQQDIEIVLTCWPQPSVQYLAEFHQEIGKYLQAAGASGLECDLESNWTRRQVQGFADLDKAGDALVNVLKDLRAKHDVRIEATTFTEHTENSKNADVASHVDRLLPQAYSVRNRTSGEIPWDGIYGPGRMQVRTLDRALQVPNEQKLACGLAAYDQVWPGRTGEEAMEVAYQAALKYNPVEIRLWSSKWVIGVRKNGYASRWLLSKVGK